MASARVGRVALISIRPRYAHAILDGRKTVEFRKRRLAEDVTHVVIYSTRPDRAVIGFFRVGGQETLPPNALWDEFQDEGEITQDDFFDYYRGYSHGTVIKVERVTRLPQELSLSRDLGIKAPPQSFRYLSQDTFEKVLVGA